MARGVTSSAAYAALIMTMIVGCADLDDPSDEKLAFDMFELTTPGGQEVEINPSQVVQLRGPPNERMNYYHESVKCLVYTSDGKFVPVIQDCLTVRKMIKAAGGG